MTSVVFPSPAAVSLKLALGGWAIERLWFYLLGAALAILVGIQLVVFWVIIGVLDELSRRELQVARDMGDASDHEPGRLLDDSMGQRMRQ